MHNFILISFEKNPRKRINEPGIDLERHIKDTFIAHQYFKIWQFFFCQENCLRFFSRRNTIMSTSLCMFLST